MKYRLCRCEGISCSIRPPFALPKLVLSIKLFFKTKRFDAKKKHKTYLYHKLVKNHHIDRREEILLSHPCGLFVFVSKSTAPPKRGSKKYYSKHSANSKSVLIRSFNSSGKTSIQPFQNDLGSDGKFSLGKATLATKGAVY